MRPAEDGRSTRPDQNRRALQASDSAGTAMPPVIAHGTVKRCEARHRKIRPNLVWDRGVSRDIRASPTRLQ
jgi:hypothetical protein